MSVLDAVLRLLKKEEEQLDRELSGITAAIAAFRKTYASGKGAPSRSRRTRIAAGPKARSVKGQKKPKVVSIKSKPKLSAAAGKKAASTQKARSAKVKMKRSA